MYTLLEIEGPHGVYYALIYGATRVGRGYREGGVYLVMVQFIVLCTFVRHTVNSFNSFGHNLISF